MLFLADATRRFLDAMDDIKHENISGNLIIIDRSKTIIRKEKLED